MTAKEEKENPTRGIDKDLHNFRCVMQSGKEKRVIEIKGIKSHPSTSENCIYQVWSPNLCK